jgi:DNA mismatch endonuclease (patch repair protein)
VTGFPLILGKAERREAGVQDPGQPPSWTEPGQGLRQDERGDTVTDVYPPAKRAAVMRAVRSAGTAPEIAVRRLIWGLGGRYRLNRPHLPGKPDLVLPGRRLAIFVHGCFWHGHDCARGARTPKANRDYWVNKIARNRQRDMAARDGLRARGWRVETVWECEIRDMAALAARAQAWLMTAPPP